MNEYPTIDEPDNIYIYAGTYIGLDPHMRRVNRQTYSALDWLGDWGGLLDGLFLLAEVLVYPVSAHALYQRVTSVAIRHVKYD